MYLYYRIVCIFTSTPRQIAKPPFDRSQWVGIRIKGADESELVFYLKHISETVERDAVAHALHHD